MTDVRASSIEAVIADDYVNGDCSGADSAVATPTMCRTTTVKGRARHGTDESRARFIQPSFW